MYVDALYFVMITTFFSNLSNSALSFPPVYELVQSSSLNYFNELVQSSLAFRS